jgi:hypothetical protein
VKTSRAAARISVLRAALRRRGNADPACRTALAESDSEVEDTLKWSLDAASHLDCAG